MNFDWPSFWIGFATPVLIVLVLLACYGVAAIIDDLERRK